MAKPARILCVDTSDVTLGCIIARAGEIEGQVLHHGQRDHCKNIITLADQLLQDVGLVLSDIDGFACIIGPGSFTGLRIGLMAAKTFAYVENKPLLGINTFERMVQTDHLANAVYVWPAQRGHCYATQSPLASPDHFRFGPMDKIIDADAHIYSPQGFEINNRQQTSLPFAEICGTPLAQRLDLHWQEKRRLDPQQSAPLYIQEVAAKKNLGS
ncbi:MAG: tRNA (adenosine(37)-N6)-threonylcarbamoyltransferase complex dimerization subunit type 1 TsaB [Deltaproteobacteria bacterium]|nr:tRNA (adenosine(37)-N6)-threonylcarbamoyltransferase complex dimerization subunit type 1 TsaB [Deltaproteobacteria bacterium]